MKKTLNTDDLSKINGCLKMADTIIQSLIPLIDGEVLDSMDENAIPVIKIILNVALSQLNEAKKIIEAP